AELQFLQAQFPDVSALEILYLATQSGARALGRGKSCGSLAPGKRADLAIVALDDPAFTHPERDLFAPGNRIVGTMLGGEWVHRAPGLLAETV
ncbi:MAG TPA: amidohydrolase family protein, partial [Planctomycetaceae bacterium]|nr:amidohydrolase family protein [Planctomycetaceae bacterium]